MFERVAKWVEWKDTPDGPAVVDAWTDEEFEALNAQRPVKENPGVYVEIARLPDRAIVTEEALSRMLSVTCRTVRRMVQRNEIPPPVALAGKAVWFVGNILEHIQKRVERLTQKTERRQLARDRLVA